MFNSFSDFRQGLNILAKYFEDPNGPHVCSAEEGMVYIQVTDRPMSKDDVAWMKSMNWLQTRSDDRQDPYDPEMGWRWDL